MSQKGQKYFTKLYHKTPYTAIDPSQPSLSAAAKTILITAGATGIGFCIAQNFAIAGAQHIILLARRTDVLEKSTTELSATYPGTTFHYFTSSITDHAKIRHVFSEIRSKISSIDVLVTSAAYPPALANTLDLPTQELLLSFDTNLFANINLVHEFLSHTPAPCREKVILDISSAVAYLMIPKRSAYSVSKLAFTQWLARLQQELVDDESIRIHSFHPGSVWTDCIRGLGMSKESFAWDDVQLPGQFAVWLASKEAAFLKGRFVWANWDVEELVGRKGEFERDTELLTVGLKGLC
ncbi:hypothetical protein BDR22DRAFT_827265 [Usnea florida]